MAITKKAVKEFAALIKARKTELETREATQGPARLYVKTIPNSPEAAIEFGAVLANSSLYTMVENLKNDAVIYQFKSHAKPRSVVTHYANGRVDFTGELPAAISMPKGWTRTY